VGTPAVRSRRLALVDDAEVGRTIAERLGWLDAPADASDDIPALEGFGDGIVDAGFTTASSPGWAAAASLPTCCIGRSVRARGISICASSIRPIPRPWLRSLDDLDPLRTLVIVASKSGTTVEPNAFLAEAWHRVEEALAHVQHHVYDRPVPRSSRSPTRARASRRSPITTSSARSSSITPTWAGATAR
jgi:hypothetical protein